MHFHINKGPVSCTTQDLLNPFSVQWCSISPSLSCLGSPTMVNMVSCLFLAYNSSSANLLNTDSMHILTLFISQTYYPICNKSFYFGSVFGMDYILRCISPHYFTHSLTLMLYIEYVLGTYYVSRVLKNCDN